MGPAQFSTADLFKYGPLTALFFQRSGSEMENQATLKSGNLSAARLRHGEVRRVLDPCTNTNCTTAYIHSIWACDTLASVFAKTLQVCWRRPNIPTESTKLRGKFDKLQTPPHVVQIIQGDAGHSSTVTAAPSTSSCQSGGEYGGGYNSLTDSQRLGAVPWEEPAGRERERDIV